MDRVHVARESFISLLLKKNKENSQRRKVAHGITTLRAVICYFFKLKLLCNQLKKTIKFKRINQEVLSG